MKLIHIIFGWLLGILSPYIIDFIKNIMYEFSIWNWKIDSEEPTVGIITSCRWGKRSCASVLRKNSETYFTDKPTGVIVLYRDANNDSLEIKILLKSTTIERVCIRRKREFDKWLFFHSIASYSATLFLKSMVKKSHNVLKKSQH